MPKNSFTFKQFTINQDLCAMKVCTDACVFGASTEVENVNRILDIGTGTGLLSLMLAQRTNAQIDSVEIDEDTYQQAVMNVEVSKFAKNIKVHHQRIQNFESTKNAEKIIDMIPFRTCGYKITPKKYLEYAKYPERAIKSFIKDEHFNPEKPYCKLNKFKLRIITFLI